MRVRHKLSIGTFLAFSIFSCTVLILESSRVAAIVPYVAERVNLTSSGTQITNGNTQGASLSQDGRYVAFGTSDPNVVPGDTNSAVDIFVRDRKLNTTVRVSLSSAGGQIANADTPKISANGRFVAFESTDPNVVPGDTNGRADLFLRDLKNNTTEMVSLTSSGGVPNEGTSTYDISADGRYVVFSSSASNIVSGDTNNSSDVFVRDRINGTTTLLSKTSTGNPGNGSSITPAITCDGSYVTFTSVATDLVSGDVNGVQDVFLVNRIGGYSVSNITIGANDNSGSGGRADISCNGATIVFRSKASNIVPNDTNSAPDIFAYHMIDGSFERINLDPSGNETVWSPNPNNGTRAITSDGVDFSGRYVVFSGSTSTLVSGDTNNVDDVFLRDLEENTTQIISKRSSTTSATGVSSVTGISLNGAEVIFTSSDSGLVAGDTNSIPDVFVSKTGI